MRRFLISVIDLKKRGVARTRGVMRHNRSKSTGASTSRTAPALGDADETSMSMWYAKYGENGTSASPPPAGNGSEDRPPRPSERGGGSCCFRRARTMDKDGFSPLADLPSKDPRNGPHFRFEVNDMMRLVHEGEGKIKIARYNEQKLVRAGWLERKVWHTTYLASVYCWLQIFLLWFLAGIIACLVYAGLRATGGNEKTVESLQSGLTISSTIELFVAFILGSYIKKTIDIW